MVALDPLPRGRSLAPVGSCGAYQLQATARNAAGLASKPVVARFRVKK